MATTNAIPYEVTLNQFTDSKNKLYIIPSQSQLDEMIAALDADIAVLQADAAQEPDDRALPAALRELQRVRAQRVNLRDSILPQSKPTIYTLTCPTYGELIEYRAYPGVRSVDTKNKSGVAAIDDERLMQAMLPRCIQGLDEQAVKALHPDIAARLYAELKGLIQPDPAEIPMTPS